jgi:outer membrane receptor for ferrienterochelin and colicins
MKSLVLFFFIILCGGVVAQTNTDSIATSSMDEVIVTATRSPRLLSNIAIPASIVSAKTLYQSGSLRLSDILAEQTGIAVIDNFGKGIQMQGLSSEYTLILLNGEPLIGRTGGVLDLSRITIKGIKKIEIIKGPSSSLYGSEAMGGVINIITDQPGIRKSDLNLRYGRFNTVDGSFDIARRIHKLDVQISSDYNRSEGYSLKPNAMQQTVEPFWRSTQQISLSLPIADKWKFGLTARHNNTYIDNTISVLNGGNTIVSKGFEKSNEYNINPFIRRTISPKISTTFRGYFTGFIAIQELSVKDALGGYDDEFKQQFNRIENQTDWHIRAQSNFNAGAGFIQENVRSNRYDSLSTKRENQIGYIFTQHEEKVTKKLTFIAGLRYDANKAYSSVLSPKAAFQYAYNEFISFNVSYGKGFKAPDFRQLYLNFTNVAAGSYSVFGASVAQDEVKRLSDLNSIDQTTSMLNTVSVLKPEVSGGFNAGVKVKFPHELNAQANFFRNDISNMIVTDVIAFKKSGGQIYSYFNLKQALTQGVELEASKRLRKSINIKVGYQYLYTADKQVLRTIKHGEVYQRSIENGAATRMTVSDYGGLPYRSKHSANIKLNYENKSGFFTTIRLIYRGRWGTYDIDGNGLINREDEFAKGYMQANSSIGYSASKHWDIMLGVDNIFNYKDLLFLPGNPGRSGYINLQLHL